MSIEGVKPEVELIARRRTIVTALPLKRAARQRLAELLDARVLDIREPCDDPDLVLTPACSPQLINALAHKYNGAQVVVVELDDWEFNIELSGPVKRILRSGAAAYVLADSIDELAAKITSKPLTTDSQSDHREVHELTSGSTVDDLIAAFLRESVEYSTRQRHNGARGRRSSHGVLRIDRLLNEQRTSTAPAAHDGPSTIGTAALGPMLENARPTNPRLWD